MFHVKAGYPNTNNAIESFHKILKRIFTSYVKGTVKSLLECLIEKLVTYYSKNPTDFKYFREPENQMKQKARLLSESSFVIDKLQQNTYNYMDKYKLWVTPNVIYQGFNCISCSCNCFYKSYVCKHAIKLADTFGFKLKGYNKVEVFATNAKRGPKPKKKTHNPLEAD